MNKSNINTIFNSRIFQYALLFIVAIVIWQIFYPGLMSPDSLAQYEQARNSRYDDWHPPLMSLVLKFLMIFGGDISLMSLIQCLAAIFGLRSVVTLLLVFFSNGTVSRESAGKYATLTTIIFLIPIFTPYMFFSVIFWKDAWVAIVGVWIISYALWIYLNLNLLSQKIFVRHLILFSFSSAALVLIRHNSLVMLPVLCVVVGMIAKLRLGKIGFAAAALPLFLALILNPLINTIFDVGKTYTGNTVLASDLAVMLKIYPELDSEFPLAARHKNAPTVLLTDNGGVWNDTVEGKPCPFIDKKKCDSEMPLACFGNPENTFEIADNDCYMRVGLDNKLLKDEYYKAIITHPFRLLRTKVYLFRQMLHSRNWYPQAVSCEIAGNSLGLKVNDTFKAPRDVLCYLNHDVGNKWLLNYISGVHILWLILDGLFVIYFGFEVLRKRDGKSVLSLLLFLLPLSYYLSYITAATTPDYRFMYPSTLMMQVLFVSLTILNFPSFYRKLLSFGIDENELKKQKSLVSHADSKEKNDIISSNVITSEEKAEIVLEGLKGRSEDDICETYNIKKAQYIEWRDEFLQNSALAFTGKVTDRESQLELENKELKKVIEEMKKILA